MCIHLVFFPHVVQDFEEEHLSVPLVSRPYHVFNGSAAIPTAKPLFSFCQN